MEENIREFHRFWNDRKCFLTTIFYLVIILTKKRALLIATAI